MDHMRISGIESSSVILSQDWNVIPYQFKIELKPNEIL